MEKELLNTFDKELLLKDLCGRLPYGVKVNGVFLTYDKDKDKILYKECVKELNYSHLSRYWTLKPYLFPLSSMTDEQKREFYKFFEEGITESANETRQWLRTKRADETMRPITIAYVMVHELVIEWLNKNHFDYRGLIEKGLAIDATGLNIY